MQKISYLYCDANVFLAYFNAETGRVEILDQLFEEVQKDDGRKIITSVMSITEVSHVAEEKSRQRLASGVQNKIERFWNDTSLVEFMVVDEFIARLARNLIRQAISMKYILRTNDAIHLTSAKYAGVYEFFTYDQKLFKFGSIQGYNIREPYVSAPKLPLIFPDDPQAPS